MKKFLLSLMVVLLAVTAYADTNYQLPDSHFEDWSGATFNGEIQPKYWHGSNVEQGALGMTFRFNFMYRETGRTGYCAMTKGRTVGAAGITEEAPGYFSLGTAWQYLEGLNTSSATAGTYGGISFTHRPDSVAVWIKRTGSHTADEDFQILFYAWSGTAKGNKYLNKGGTCTQTSGDVTDEESDVRQALDGNECGTKQKANQVAEGWLFDRKQYNQWTRITVPIYYLNDVVPEKCNMIFSASNYPNFRANNGIYADNALYVDDVELIYSSKIQELWIGGKKWNGFDPNSTDVQVYSLGQDATDVVRNIEAIRGAGTLTTKSATYTRASKFTKTAVFPGRKLQEGTEVTINHGVLDGAPTTITVHAEDGSSTTTYQIQFQRAASTNAKLAGLGYVLNGDTTMLSNFSLASTTYNVELPYGTTATPRVVWVKAEDEQTVTATQPTSPTGTATLVVTAANPSKKETYTVNFSLGLLKDNTLKDIKIKYDNTGFKSVPGFSPSQTIYKVSLPVSTTTMPTVQAVSAYPTGEQTITYTVPSVIDGGTYLVSVKAPGNATTKTYKLNFKLEASSYSRLANLEVQGDQIASVTPAKQGQPTVLDFQPEALTYFVNLKMGTKKMPQILYTRGDEYQTVAIDTAGIDGTTRVTVTAGNGTDQTIYKLVFQTAKSEISTLEGIEVGGVALPGFRADSTNYTYQLPIGTTTLPEIRPIAHDEFQTITVAYPAGVNGKARITVTAGNGATTNYYITFSVLKYTTNTIEDLRVEGYSLQDANYQPIAFDSLRNEYWVKLDSNYVPRVSYVLKSELYQDTAVMYPATANGNYKLTIRPKNGSARTYTIHFVYKTSDNTALQMIYLDGTPLPGFEPEKISYTHTLDTGAVVMPTITWDLGDASQTVAEPVWEGRTVRLTVFAQSGAKRIYKIKFIVPSAASTQLDSIKLVEGNDTIMLPGFRKDQSEYEYALNGATCPQILAYKSGDQKVTITAPYAAGTAVIKVTSKDGDASSQYTIEFTKTAVATVRLKGIKIDGVSLTNFQPTKLSYDTTYVHELPHVVGVKTDDTEVEALWKGETAWIHVSDAEGNKAAYSVAFTQQVSGDNALEAIYADGSLIAGFESTLHTYAYTLPAGSSYPALSYKAKEEAQVVFFGPLEPGKWGITVEAANGDTTTYTVQYTISPYSDATLAGLTADTVELSPAFAPNQFNYTATLDEGAALPQLAVVTREGQTVLVANQSDTVQTVIVYAESGATNTYTITYNRQTSNNALLADILIDGVSIPGFRPDSTNYVDTLERGTTFVPNVFPRGQLPNQTITTYFSRPDGVTRIHVEAQSGAEKDYFVAFPTRKSGNNALEDIALDAEDAEIKFKRDTLNYTVILPFEATECPKILVEKGDAAQRVDLVMNPIGETSQVIVTAEDGTTRTYNILFKREVLKTKNLLSMIRIVELDQELSLKDKAKRDFEVEMPYGSRSLTIEYEKAYPEQTVFVQPGGVNDTTFITVIANNDTVENEVYRIIPSVPTADPAVLTDIKINGTTITGFEGEHFSYIVKVTDKPILRYTLNKGAEINILEQTSKHWKAEVTYGERTNIYDVWYYYQNDVVPNMDFQNWENARATTSARKPTGWNVLADFAEPYEYKPLLVTYTFTPGEEVQQDGSNSVAYLHTQYNDAPLAGYIPGYMTLGDIEYHYQRWGSSAFSVSGGMTFRNTPDEMSYRAKVDQVNNNARVLYTLNGSGGEETLLQELTKTSGYVTRTMDLTPANAVAEEPTQLNITFNSFDSESGKNGTVGGEAKMYVDWMRLAFNHTLTGMTVDGADATKTGNAFAYTLPNSEYIERPILAFTGEVADQAQDVTWNDTTFDANYEIRTASIRNWAENGVDYTDYTLTVRRPLDSLNVLANLYMDSLQITDFAAENTSYTIELPATRRHLPSLMPVPGSSLQKVTTSFNAADSTMTITVTPEKGAPKTYTVKFVTKRSNKTTLQNISCEGISFEAETREYNITAAQWPIISIDKLSDLQRVTLHEGVITVTAEDGSVGTYTITRHEPTVTPNGVLNEFYLGSDLLTDFGDATHEKNALKPEQQYVWFARAQDADSVIFVQNEAGMNWSVVGAGSPYIWTYPGSASANADLKMITLDGVDYSEFSTDTRDYELGDSIVVVSPQAAEDGQTIVTEYAAVEGGVLYTMRVTAPNGTNTKQYSVRIVHPKSNIATLEGILLDGALIDGFRADSTAYTIVLPAPAGAKTAQPKMPNITYVAGHERQTVTLKAGKLYIPNSTEGEATELDVVSEDGDYQTSYSVTIQAEPSHCSDLTGLTVNGEALDHFEPGRHFYSVSLKTEAREIDYLSDDRFQTITISEDTVEKGHQYVDTIRVTAEDGSHSDYLVEIYIENQSSDNTLANILLDDDEMAFYRPDLNEGRNRFDPGDNNYHIAVPSSDTIPSVSAQLKMDGQTVSMETFKDSVLLHVVAVDGSKNTYKLYFEYEKSKNCYLSRLEANNVPFADFSPKNFYYTYDLKTGESLPRIDYETAHDSALVVPDFESNPMTLTVYAEDRIYKSVYYIACNVKKDSVCTLDMIYENGGDSLPGFVPTKKYYTRELPVDAADFPTISYGELEAGDHSRWPYIDSVTVERDTVNRTWVHETTVTAENGNTMTYTIAYRIMKSDVDTLQLITVGENHLTLPGFDPYREEYSYTLSAAEAAALGGALPLIEAIPGDEYQTVIVSQAPDSLSGKTLGYKTIITVTAASGKTRIYTIHYPVELSDDASLNMINLAGKPLTGFESDRFTYKLEVGLAAEIPVVTVIQKEEAQKVEINQDVDTIRIVVKAENRNIQETYTLYFERVRSDVTTLQNIILTENGHQLPYEQFFFETEKTDYIIEIPYDSTRTELTLPEWTIVKADTMQQITPVATQIDDHTVLLTITVTAPNGDEGTPYTLTFDFLRNNDALLRGINLDGTPLAEFKSDIFDYTYIHPFGEDSTSFFTQADIEAITRDAKAVSTVYVDETGLITILVVADDETTNCKYTIVQTLGLDTCNTLQMIYLDGKEINGFDPTADTTYVIILREGEAVPEVTYEKTRETVEVDEFRQPKPGETLDIICTAQNGDVRVYHITFQVSTINDALKPTAKDVFVRRIPGEYKLFVATIRKDVTFILYDQNGHQLLFERVPDADPNDVVSGLNYQEQDVLLNVTDFSSGLTVDIIPGQIYLYSFVEAGKRPITSGKLMVP